MTRIYTYKKWTKKEAFILVNEMRNSKVLPSEDDLDRLLNCFAPKPPTFPKSASAWVAKAVANKKDERHYLRYLYCEDGVLCGTDGRSIHRADCKWQDGFYDPDTFESVKLDARYPPIKTIFDKMVAEADEDGTFAGLEAIEDKFFEVYQNGIKVNKERLDIARAKCQAQIQVGNNCVAGYNIYGKFVGLTERDPVKVQ